MDAILDILIVDDSDFTRERIKDQLKHLINTQVHCAYDVLSALREIEVQPPDIIILDIKMPGGSGLDVLSRVRKSSDPPIVIIYTFYPYPQFKTKAFDEGADYFFDKATEFEKIPETLATIQRTLTRRQK